MTQQQYIIVLPFFDSHKYRVRPLSVHVYEMRRWVKAVLGGKSLDDLIPVMVSELSVLMR